MLVADILKTKLDTPKIVGIACGGVFALILLSVGVFQFIRTKNASSKTTGTLNSIETPELNINRYMFQNYVSH